MMCKVCRKLLVSPMNVKERYFVECLFIQVECINKRTYYYIISSIILLINFLIFENREHSHWVPADSNNLDMPKMTHVSTDVISGRVKRFTFSFSGETWAYEIPFYPMIFIIHSGPDHLGIYFSPYHGIKLINWSVDTFVPDNVGPTYNNRKTYFIFYSYGLDVLDKDYNLTLDFEV